MSLQIVDFSTTNSQVTDEIVNVADSNPIRLIHDIVYNKTGKLVSVSTGPGLTGTVLTTVTDFALGGAVADGIFPTSISPDVGYTTLSILNATYHNVDLYVNYYPIADTFNANRWNNQLRWVKEYGSKKVGEIIQAMGELTPVAWSGDVDAYNPIYDIQAGGTLDVANYPDFVPWLRSQLVKAGSSTSFAGSASGSIITLSASADATLLLEGLLEDQIFYGAYNRPITWGGSDFVITNINGVTRAITVTGTPTAGAGSATFHPYRIVGSTTTAQILAHDGLVLATGGASGRVTGLVTRDRMQGWQLGATADNTGARNTYSYASLRDNASVHGGFATHSLLYSTTTAQGLVNMMKAVDDGTNGTPRVGLTTRDRSLAVRLFAHVGRYI